MGYPNPSSFISPDPFSAWWFYSVGGVQNVCESTGAAIVRRARQALGLPASLAWDQQLVDRLRAVDAGDPMRTAIWVAYYREQGATRPIGGISIPSGAALPSMSGSVPDDRGAYGGRLVCFIPASDPPPESLASAALQTAFAQSATGLRIGPGHPEPRFDVTVSSMGSVVGPVGIGLAAVAIVGAAWWWSRR